jgi:hypothetical protein
MISFGHPRKTPWLVTVWRDGVRLGTITRGRRTSLGHSWAFSAFMNQPRLFAEELEAIAAKTRRLNDD